MLRRLFLFFLPSLTASICYANEASWNCEQNKDSKEWVCVGEKKQATKSSVAAPPSEPETAKAVQPARPESVEKTQPVEAQPVQVTEPVKTEKAERIQPVTAESERITPPVAAQPIENIQPAKPGSVQDNQALATAPVKNIQPAPSAAPKPVVDNSKLTGKEVNRPGWTCGANKKDESWNCQLVGAEPKGKGEVVATEEPTFSLLTPAFDHQQEQIFNTLTSQLPNDPWENCSSREVGTNRGFIPGANLRETSPMDLKSNYAEVFDDEIGSYSGNVKMSRADQQSSSNTANYDSVSKVLDLHGNVYYSEDELALYSDTATLELATDQAKLRDVQFISPETPLRGRAKAVYRDSKTFSRYKDIASTSCRPGNQDWVIHASDLKMNKISGKASANNAWIEFKGTPVFYTPYISFPIDNRRISGFLMPSFGVTKFSGFSMSAPYYWNIAPNYDATIIPRELTKRGPLLAGKFRYLTEQSKGSAGLEYMPHDSELDKARYLGSLKNTTIFTPNIYSIMDLNYVSDKTYFSTLGNALSFANYNYLRSFANINYVDEGVFFTTLLDNYQSINEAILPTALPYRKLPQINLNLNHAFKFMPLHTAMENEYVNFQKSALVRRGINITPSGQRINTKPSISVPLETASSFFTPKLSLQHTQYFLGSGQGQLATPDTTISRTLPIFSADSGLFLEKELDFGNSSYLHTLEPRLFYLYVPFTNQQDIPVFDSAQYDFQYSSMFRENSFSGTDRIQDANQLTTALTSRLVDNKEGLERLRLSVGEIFYFRDRNVTLQYGSTPVPGSVKQTSNFSNVVAELSSELTRQLSIKTGMQWNPQLNEIQRVNAALHFATESNELFNIGYIYRNNPLITNGSNDITQTDISFRYPVYDNWYALGRWQYSWLYNTTQDGIFGVEKENCCWRFRIFGRHYINNLANLNIANIVSNSNQVITGTAQNGLFFEIELKGLSAISTKGDMDKFLQQSIYGYRKSQNDW